MPENMHVLNPKTVLHRGLQAASCNTLIALFLTLIGTRSFSNNMVYSQCIGLSIWVLIDFSRISLITDWSTQRQRLIFIVPLGVLAGYVIGIVLAGWLMGDDAITFFWAEPRKTLGMLTMSLVAGAVLTYYFLSREQLREARTRAEAMQRQATESQLKLLQTQLEPHMLFNTLANLRALIGRDPATATDMLDRLIAYLRATLQASRVTTHSLQAEFDRLGDYLELMSVRMGPRLSYKLDLPAALADVPIPTMLLQPLVENSIKHGLEPKIEGGSVRVSARRDGESVVLEVCDTGVGLGDHDEPPSTSMPSNGFGLSHVSDRLQAAYGSHATINLIATDNRETWARIIFPLENEF